MKLLITMLALLMLTDTTKHAAQQTKPQYSKTVTLSLNDFNLLFSAEPYLLQKGFNDIDANSKMNDAQKLSAKLYYQQYLTSLLKRIQIDSTLITNIKQTWHKRK